MRAATMIVGQVKAPLVSTAVADVHVDPLAEVVAITPLFSPQATIAAPTSSTAMDVA